MTQDFRLRTLLLLGLVLVCLGGTAFPLDPSRNVSQYVHHTWGPSKGFIGGEVNAIGQSADGYLWIGTGRGLVRFDGFNFTLIQRPMPDTLPAGPVRAFALDAEDNLWIRLDGPRMLIYRDGKFEDAYARFDLQGLIVTASTSDRQHRITFAGLGDRILRYDGNQFETVVGAGDAPGQVISLAAMRDASFWIGTSDDGLFRSQNGRVFKMAPELGDAKINCLAPSADGGLWIGTDDGVRLLEAGAAKLSALPSLKGLQIFVMTPDHDNNLWVGTNHGIARITSTGVVSLDLIDRTSVHEVRAILEDHDGDIWFGGSQGIERLRNGMLSSYSAAEGLPAVAGGPIYVDPQGGVWFAPIAGGLYFLRGGHAERVTLAGLDHDVVYSISGGGNEVWLGRQVGGLTVLTESGNSFAARTFTTADGLAQNSVYSVRRSRDGTIWAGTVSSGVSRLRAGKFENFSAAEGLPSNTVNSIVERMDGTIWVATPNGLASYTNAHWRAYGDRDGLPSPFVRVTFEDSKHNLWLATSGGLSYLSSGKIIVPPNLPETLRERIFGIAEDSTGSLWFTTSDHVVRVNREKLLAGSLQETDLQTFGGEDGLTGSEGVGRDSTVLADGDGRIWLSLRSGLSVADPTTTIRNMTPVAVRIESVSAGGRQFDTKDAIKLSSGIRSISLNYGGTNLSAPERIRFRYKLDGSGQGWSEIVASREVVFSNLEPGSYRFRIIASSTAGLWNGPETSLPFILEPAFWQTPAFRASCFVLLLAALWAAYFFRVRHLTTLLQLRHQERLSEREDIARDLHDTFFQGVQSLFLRLHTASRQLPENTSVRRALDDVLNDSDRVMTEGREMFLDIPETELKDQDFVQVIAGICAEFATAQPIEYRLEVDGTPRNLNPLVMAELGKIGREAIYNAFRHSSARSIEVELTYGKKEMRFRVRDDGKGFEPTLLQAKPGHLHLGLQNMKKRAEKLGADFRLWSRPGSGTELEIMLAAQRAYSTTPRRWKLFGSLRKE